MHPSLWRVCHDWLVICDTGTLEASSAPQNPVYPPLNPNPSRTSLYYSQCLLPACPFLGAKQTLVCVADCSFSSSSAKHSFPFGVLFVPPCSAARHVYVLACSRLSWCQLSLLCGLSSLAHVSFALLGFFFPFLLLGLNDGGAEGNKKGAFCSACVLGFPQWDTMCKESIAEILGINAAE